MKCSLLFFVCDSTLHSGTGSANFGGYLCNWNEMKWNEMKWEEMILFVSWPWWHLFAVFQHWILYLQNDSIVIVCYYCKHHHWIPIICKINISYLNGCKSKWSFHHRDCCTFFKNRACKFRFNWLRANDCIKNGRISWEKLVLIEPPWTEQQQLQVAILAFFYRFENCRNCDVFST